MKYTFYLVTPLGKKKSYYYFSDIKDLAVGEKVIIPFGYYNETMIGTIIKVDSFDEDRVPHPPEKIKKIEKRFDDSEASSYLILYSDAQDDFKTWMSHYSSPTASTAHSFLYDYDEDQLLEGERLNLILCAMKWEIENNCLSEWLHDELYLYYEQLVNGELDDVIYSKERAEVERDLVACFNRVYPDGLEQD